MSLLREFFVKLGLDFDEAGFASAMTTVEGLKWGLSKIGDVAQEAGRLLRDQFIHSVEEADQLGKTAQIIGVASDQLQKFAYAGDLAGVSLDGITAAATYMARKGVKDVSAELLRLSDRFAAMPDGADKTRIAAEKLGRAVGPQMIPLLNGGRAALEELFAEAPLRSKESLKAAEEFNDTWTKITYVLRGVRDTIVDELVPIFQPYLTAVLDWVKAHREVIKQKLAGVFYGIGRALKFAYTYGVKPLIAAVEFLVENWKTLAAIGTGVVIAMLIAQSAALLALAGQIISTIGWYVALGIASVVTAAKAAIAWLAVAWPFILIAALIAAVILVLEDLYQFFTGGDSVIGRAIENWLVPLTNFSNRVTAIWNSIKSGFAAVWAYIGDKIDKIKSVYGTVKGMFGGSSVPEAQLPSTGGASGPSASVENSPSVLNKGGATKINAPQFNAKIDVHATPGMDEKAVGMHVKSAMQEFHDERMREAEQGVQ